MAQLPQKLPLDLMQTRWASLINPFLGNQLNQVQILEKVDLVSGVNTINHGLGRLQQGWFLLDIDAAAVIYRSQPFNDKTLVLTSDATVTVNIGVF